MELSAGALAPIFVEAGKTAAGKAWEHRTFVRQKLARLWNRIRLGKLGVAIVGAGGVGKSTLGHLLTEKPDADTLPPDYRESLILEKYELPGDFVCTLVVPPGQEHRREESSWTGVARALATDECAGLIHVVAWGHHAFGQLPYTRHKLYESGMSPGQFMEKYLPARRAEEVRLLAQLGQALTMRKKPLWLLTVVTKQDLWWSRRHEVNQHYVSGDYEAEVQKLKVQLGSTRLKHQIVSGSLVWNNLRDHEGAVLAETTGGYEQSTRAANLARVIDSVHDLLTEGVSG